MTTEVQKPCLGMSPVRIDMASITCHFYALVNDNIEKQFFQHLFYLEI